MNTRLLMTASAAAMGIIGLSFTFLPEELLVYLDIKPERLLMYGVQLLGALYFAFAMLNWMAKGILIGGIYSRPVAIGNFVHFLIGALMFVKSLLKEPATPALWVVCIGYIAFALLFGRVVYTHPSPAASGHK